MKNKAFIFLYMLLIVNTVLADSGQEACDFFKHYKPYKNTPDSMAEICPVYVFGVFYNPKFKEIYAMPQGDSKYIVSIVFYVGKPRPEVLEVSPALTQREIMKVNDELVLEWFVDMKRKTVKPYNYLAQDCLNLFAEMWGLFKIAPQRK